MRTIWKKHIPIADESHVPMPFGSVPIHLELQNGEPTLWFECLDSMALIPHHFHWYGTGHTLPEDMKGIAYVGTIQLPNGLVFHLYLDWLTTDRERSA